jgi:hypothetical protein
LFHACFKILTASINAILSGDDDTFEGPSSVEAEANSSDGGFDDLDITDPQELSNPGGNSNDGERQVTF